MTAEIVRKHLLAATYLFVTVCGELGGKFLVLQMVQPPSDIHMLLKQNEKALNNISTAKQPVFLRG